MIELTILFGCLTIPFAIVGLWWWFWLFICIAVLVGIYELVAKIRKGKTISQMFREWRKANELKGRIVLIFLAIGWAAFLFHLASCAKVIQPEDWIYYHETGFDERWPENFE